jgi:hypothetical protein
MFSHLNNHNVLVKEKFSFRRNPSTVLATHNLLDNIYMALNNKCIVGGNFCDLSKAFDCENHNILSKMEFYGIKGIIQKLLRSYLRGRYQRVILHKNGNKYHVMCPRVQCSFYYTSMTYQKLYLIYQNQFCLQLIPESFSQTRIPQISKYK